MKRKGLGTGSDTDMEVEFKDLETADLIFDCIYKGGTAPNMSAEPFHKLIPGCENAGGISKKTARRWFG